MSQTPIDVMRAERLNYIGASDVGKLLLDQDGHPIHPYGSPHEVWLDKMGLSQFEDNERTIMGLLLEPIICKRFALAQPGIRLATCPTVCGGPDHHRCNPDRLVVPRVRQVPGTSLIERDRKGLTAIYQIKTAGYFGAKDFGVEGTDEVPDWYLAQVQWELYCTGRELAVLGLLYDTHLYKQYLVYRDQELIDALVRIVDNFWTRYVLTKEAPPVTSHKKDTEWLNGAWTPKPDAQVVASDAINDEVEKLSRELGHLEKLSANIDLRKNRIREFMGDASSLLTGYGEITWKANKNGVRTLRLDQIKSAAPAKKVS